MASFVICQSVERMSPSVLTIAFSSKTPQRRQRSLTRLSTLTWMTRRRQNEIDQCRRQGCAGARRRAEAAGQGRGARDPGIQGGQQSCWHSDEDTLSGEQLNHAAGPHDQCPRCDGRSKGRMERIAKIPMRVLSSRRTTSSSQGFARTMDLSARAKDIEGRVGKDHWLRLRSAPGWRRCAKRFPTSKSVSRVRSARTTSLHALSMTSFLLRCRER